MYHTALLQFRREVFEDRLRVLVCLPCMYHYRPVLLASHLELRFKGSNLRIPVGVLVVIVESNLAYRHNLIVLQASF